MESKPRPAGSRNRNRVCGNATSESIAFKTAVIRTIVDFVVDRGYASVRQAAAPLNLADVLSSQAMPSKLIFFFFYLCENGLCSRALFSWLVCTYGACYTWCVLDRG